VIPVKGILLWADLRLPAVVRGINGPGRCSFSVGNGPEQVMPKSAGPRERLPDGHLSPGAEGTGPGRRDDGSVRVRGRRTGVRRRDRQGCAGLRGKLPCAGRRLVASRRAVRVIARKRLRDPAIIHRPDGNLPRSARKASVTRKSSARRTANLRDHPAHPATARQPSAKYTAIFRGHARTQPRQQHADDRAARRHLTQLRQSFPVTRQLRYRGWRPPSPVSATPRRR
jgi:hypothetical protein